jgi:hypothetical protein
MDGKDKAKRAVGFHFMAPLVLDIRIAFSLRGACGLGIEFHLPQNALPACRDADYYLPQNAQIYADGLCLPECTKMVDFPQNALPACREAEKTYALDTLLHPYHKPS